MGRSWVLTKYRGLGCWWLLQFEMGVKLLKEMTEEAGLKPNNMSFRGLIKGLTKRGDFVKCLDLLDVSHGLAGKDSRCDLSHPSFMPLLSIRRWTASGAWSRTCWC